MKEKNVLAEVRLAVQKLGATLFRNTVGRFRVVDDVTGDLRWVQTGLCVGSSDSIGLTEYIIKPQDVGRKIAVFTALETKRTKGGRITEEQKLFVQWVIRSGGIAGFARSAEDAERIVREFTGG